MSELMESRNTLRAAALAARKSLTPDRRLIASTQVAMNLLSLPVVDRAHAIALYLALPEEVSTLPLIDRLRRRTHPPLLAAPVIQPPRRLAMYPLPQDLSVLEKGPLRILQPLPQGQEPLPPTSFDAILIPGVAFDSEGHRLGFGAGYYDRYLAQFRYATREADGPSGPPASPAIPRPQLIGVCFSVQLLPAIPAAAHDIPMDLVVTEDTVLRCSRA